MKLVLLLLGTFIFLGNTSAPYCSCDKDGSVQEAVENSDLVLIGNVVGKNLISKNFREQGNNAMGRLMLVQYKIKVIKPFKGVNRDKTIFLYATRESGACGLKLELGEEYTIFGNKGTFLPSTLAKHLKRHEKDSYWSSSCSLTQKSQENHQEVIVSSLGEQ